MAISNVIEPKTVKIGAESRRITLRKAVPYLLIAPSFILLAVVLLYPIIYNLFLGFWQWRFTDLDNVKFVGLENYRYLIFEDPDFWPSLKFTLLFTVVTLGVEFFAGLGSALLLNRLKTGKQIITALVLLPYMVAPIAAGLVWRLFWARDFGLVNWGLHFFGVGPVNWLGDAQTALWSVAVPEIWRSMPFVILLLLAGLTSMPTDIFEAARSDGANRWQSFRYLTLPLLLPSITIALVFQSIFKLRVFDLVFILTGGGPGVETTSLGILVYRTYFRYFEGGAAAAQSVVLLVLGAGISFVYLKLLYKQVEY
jgi:multiple sugar transport system permease protein